MDHAWNYHQKELQQQKNSLVRNWGNFHVNFVSNRFDVITRDVTYKSRKMIDTPSIWIFCFVLWNFESLSLVIGYNQSDASIGWYHFLSGMTLYFNDPLGNSSIHNLHFHHPIGIHIIWSILCHAYLGTI